MVPVVTNIVKRSAAKTYYPVSFLSIVSKVFQKLVNNRLAGHLTICGLISDFQYGSSSCHSTTDI